MSLDVEIVEQQSALLGRQRVHDEKSRAFSMQSTVDRSVWRDRVIRLYDPMPNPNQAVGCCTGVAKCNQLNAAGNRKAGRILKLVDAERIYSRGSEIDPWDGSWPPADTGSSGLASAKAAVEFGLGLDYRWIFGGADEVVQNIVEGRVISVGTRWDRSMFDRDSDGRIHPDGSGAGGHQYAVRGYDAKRDWVLGRCWWGKFRDFWVARADFDLLLRDGGDAHFQKTA